MVACYHNKAFDSKTLAAILFRQTRLMLYVVDASVSIPLEPVTMRWQGWNHIRAQPLNLANVPMVSQFKDILERALK